LGGDIAGNGLSKLFLTIAAAFAEAERDRIRERISQVKADQKARGLTPQRSFPVHVAESTLTLQIRGIQNFRKSNEFVIFAKEDVQC